MPRREAQAAVLAKVQKLVKEKDRDPVTNQVIAVRIESRLRYQLSGWSVGRRLADADLRARIPAAKELYSDDERATRLHYAYTGAMSPPGYWDDVAFHDEVKFIFARGHTLRRLLGKRVRFVYRRKGERYHPECVKPRHMQAYLDGVHVKFFVTVACGQVVLCVDGHPYKWYSNSAKGEIDQFSYSKYMYMAEEKANATRDEFIADVHATRY